MSLMSAEELRVRAEAAWKASKALHAIGAELVKVEPGEAHIAFPNYAAFCQHSGFLHAGILAMVVDGACGFAVCSYMAADETALTVEFKVNFTAPASAEKYLAIGKVVKQGKTLHVCQGMVTGMVGGKEKIFAVMQSTMMNAKMPPAFLK